MVPVRIIGIEHFFTIRQSLPSDLSRHVVVKAHSALQRIGNAGDAALFVVADDKNAHLSTGALLHSGQTTAFIVGEADRMQTCCLNFQHSPLGVYGSDELPPGRGVVDDPLVTGIEERCVNAAVDLHRVGKRR